MHRHEGIEFAADTVETGSDIHVQSLFLLIAWDALKKLLHIAAFELPAQCCCW